MPNIVYYGEFLKTWSWRSNSVTRQVSFNRTKIGGKCQNSKIRIRHFEYFLNTVSLVKVNNHEIVIQQSQHSRQCTAKQVVDSILNCPFYDSKWKRTFLVVLFSLNWLARDWNRHSFKPFLSFVTVFANHSKSLILHVLLNCKQKQC